MITGISVFLALAREGLVTVRPGTAAGGSQAPGSGKRAPTHMKTTRADGLEGGARPSEHRAFETSACRLQTVVGRATFGLEEMEVGARLLAASGADPHAQHRPELAALRGGGQSTGHAREAYDYWQDQSV